MRIHGDVWFVVQVRTCDSSINDEEDVNEILVGDVSDLLNWAGNYGVDDVRGKFTTKKEAERFAKTQKVR